MSNSSLYKLLGDERPIRVIRTRLGLRVLSNYDIYRLTGKIV